MMDHTADLEVSQLNRMGSVSSATKRTIMPSTRDLVSDFIAKDSVVIFSKTSCPYCKMAKKVFDSLKKPYTAIELDDRDDAQEIQDILNEITGARTVPRVFLNGVCLGGGTDVKKLYDSGELEKKF
ncbi:PREDICTED: glutaredoxin-C4-like isoform X2 [Wasmannia auropunctata]|uniref:glutaredoxin-C4-like isoform X2 n=2 Tax=Wasmannia auropunctata TaxID=64793 RepID=UPI0005EDBE1D|nr:PREDICTED: glutaredoxin-C4-like isoform X2 [Wasmannia auropunctata]